MGNVRGGWLDKEGFDGGWQSNRVMIMGFHEGRAQKGYTAVNDNSFPRDLTTEILG